MKSLVYRILKAEDHRELENQVQQYINNGWTLHGGPFAASNNFQAFYQAMIRQGDSDDSDDAFGM